MFRKFGGEMRDRIEEYENTIHMRLPNDYRQFLADTNGGQFVDEVYTFWVEALKQDIGIDVLFGFHDLRSLCLENWYQEYIEDLPENTIIIGNSINAGLILLIWQEDWKGVFLWDNCLELEQSTEEDCLYQIANAFDLFYTSLKTMESMDAD